MNMKRNLIILGVAAVLVVGFVVAMSLTGGGTPAASPSATPAPTADTSLQIMDKKTADTSEVSVQNAKASFTVSWDGSKYVLKGQEGRELDQSNAGTFFAGVSAITAVKLVEQNPKDLSQYGLDKPQATITAKYKDGTTGVFLIGNKNPTGDAYYFMKQGDPRVVTIYTSFGDSFLGTSDALYSKQALAVTKDTVDTVKVAKDGETVLEMTSRNVGKATLATWMLQKPWVWAVNSNNLDSYLTAVTSISMDTVVDANPKDLAQYGLDKPAYDITISGKDNKSDEILVGKAKDDTYTYAKFANSDTVYQALTSSLSFTGTSAYMLADKSVMLMNIQYVTSVDVQGLGQQGTLNIQQTPQKDDSGAVRKDTSGNTINDQAFSMDGKQLDTDTARYFYQVCISLMMHSQIPEGKKPSSDTPAMSITFHRNTDPAEVKVEFLPYDNDFYAIRVNGGTNFLITKDQVQSVADDLAKLKAGTLVDPNKATATPSAAPSLAPAASAPEASAQASPAPAAAGNGTQTIILVVAAVVVLAVVLVVLLSSRKRKQKEN